MAGAITSRLEIIQKKAGVTAREVALLLGTTPETVSRWQTGKTDPQPDNLDYILQLEYLVGELSEFYPPEEARLWLFAPHKLLDGQRPSDLIKRGEFESVLRIIGQLKDGAFI